MKYLVLLILFLPTSIATSLTDNTVQEGFKDCRTYSPFDFKEYKTLFSISFNATSSGPFGHAFVTIYENKYLPTLELYNPIEHSSFEVMDFNKLKYLNKTKSLGKYPKSIINKIIFFDSSSLLKEDNNLTPEYTLVVQVDYKTYMKINDMVKKIQESNKESYLLSKQDCVNFIINLASEIPFLNIPKRSIINSLPLRYVKELIEINRDRVLDSI